MEQRTTTTTQREKNQTAGVSAEPKTEGLTPQQLTGRTREIIDAWGDKVVVEIPF